MKSHARPEPVSFGQARPPLLAKVSIGLLILFVLITNILLLIDARRRFQEHTEKDQISLYEKRFTQLRQALKPGTVVGYFTDEAPESKDYVKNFYLTQYALAPVIVTREIDRHWVIGNFAKPADVPGVAPHGRFYLWKDFGNGVALFQQKNK